MLKQRLITILAGVALFIAFAGSAGVVADSLGVPVTPHVFACQNPSGSGGGC